MTLLLNGNALAQDLCRERERKLGAPLAESTAHLPAFLKTLTTAPVLWQ